MERLTKHTKFLDDDCYEALGYGAIEQRKFFQLIKKLAQYEDAEEQGLLIRVECRCRDCVHVDYAGCLNTTCYCMKNGCFMQKDDFCKYAEKHKEEAEQALAKMKGE